MTTVKIIIIILIIDALFSCSSTNKKTEPTSDTQFKDTTISFSGYWLCKDYFESINNFKSPKKAQDNSQFIYVPERTLKQTMMISNFHEGGPLLTILSNAGQYELWGIQDDSLTQRLSKIEIIDDTNIKIGNRLFVKINAIKSDNGSKILEEILFKGIYTDTLETTIEFKNNGTLSGLENFKIYEPIIDYWDAGMQVDQIGLGKNNNELEYFGFKFNSDTLELFKLNCLTFDSSNKMCVEVELGQMAHKLWKKE